MIMMGRSKANVDVIDTVPADEVWKVESMLFDGIGHNGYAKFYHNNQGIFCYFNDGEQKPKFPFWLHSEEVIILPYRLALQPNTTTNVNNLRAISILRFKKPD